MSCANMAIHNAAGARTRLTHFKMTSFFISLTRVPLLCGAARWICWWQKTRPHFPISFVCTKCLSCAHTHEHIHTHAHTRANGLISYGDMIIIHTRTRAHAPPPQKQRLPEPRCAPSCSRSITWAPRFCSWSSIFPSTTSIKICIKKKTQKRGVWCTLSVRHLCCMFGCTCMCLCVKAWNA